MTTSLIHFARFCGTKQSFFLHCTSHELNFTRSLKPGLLYKKKKKRKMKVRDGKEYTVDHLFWDKYFEKHPEVLEERALMNSQNARKTGKKPLSPTKIYDTLTSSDKRYANCNWLWLCFLNWLELMFVSSSCQLDVIK